MDKEVIREKVDRAKEYVEKHKKAFVVGAKILACMAVGYKFGYKSATKKAINETHKIVPDVCISNGRRGIDAYKYWIKDNVPEVEGIITAFCDKHPDKENVLPYFLNHPEIVKQFMLVGADPDDILKKMGE